MRIAFVGASPLAILATQALIERGHEVVVIEDDVEQLEALSEQLDCGLISGDGSRPAVLEEVGPEQTDFLICLSDRDESNILAALVGRSLGFGRVVPRIEDPDLEPLCTELGLADVIVPDRDMATILVDLVEGRDNADVMTVVHAGLRFVAIQVPTGVQDCEGLDLPDGAKPIAWTRADSSKLVQASTRFEEGDQVVLIVEEDLVGELHERFSVHGGEEAGAEDDGGSTKDA